MTKTEFGEQFKRLRVAGYRLPVFDGVKVNDIVDEWFETFKGCTAQELASAIDRLRQDKTDTFWPATGELWQHIHQVRKERSLRHHRDSSDAEWPETPGDVRQQLAADFRSFADRLSQRMTMPHAEPQTKPDGVA